MRVVVRSVAGDPHPLEHFLGPLHRATATDERLVGPNRLGTWSPTRRTGLSEFIAPWNTIASPRPADGPHLARVERHQILPVEQDLTLHHAPARRQQSQHGQRGGRLPEPDSPTRPIVSPRRRSNETSFAARSGPLGESNSTIRLRTLSSGAAAVTGRVGSAAVGLELPADRRAPAPGGGASGAG